MKRVSCATGWGFGVACLGCHAEAASPAMSTTTGTTEVDDGSSSHVETPTTSSEGSTGATSTSGPDDATAGDGSGGVSTGEAPPGSCGDGVKSYGEGCDLGYGSNSDAGACTQGCQKAVCGDGLLWVGEEQCDAGAGNNDDTYGGCREDCTPGPRCDDGVLQPDIEECDAAAPPAEGVVACEPGTCRFAARVAFVTTATYTGALGGLEGADAICVAAAKAAGLDNAGSFKAWLSDGVAGPAHRFDASDADDYPYARRDGKLLASGFANLTNVGLQFPLDLTEFGVQLPAEALVWTATNSQGQPYLQQDSCGQWTSEEFKNTAVVGQVSPGPGGFGEWKAFDRWTSFMTRACFYDDLHLYCFED